MKPTRPEFRPATAADYEEFFGEPPEHSMKAHVVLLDGVPVALGGIIYHQGVLYAFSEIRDELRPYKVSIVKYASKIRELLAGAPGVAVANPDEPGAEQLLLWLGFEHVSSCEAGEVYQWARKR